MFERFKRPPIDVSMYEPQDLWEKASNDTLVAKLGEIIQKKDKIIDTINTQQVIFKPNPTEYGKLADYAVVHRINHKTWANKLLANIPDGFALPAYHVQIEKPMSSKVETPYGELPRNVIGLSNKLYKFETAYFLNEIGQAVKRFDVLEDHTPFSKTQMQGFIKLGSVSEKGSCYARLNPNDRTEITNLIIRSNMGRHVALS
jgi:hypothetical protein